MKSKADSLAENEDFSNALTYYKIAINKDPNNYKIHESIAQILLELGEFFEAIKEATKSIEIAPEWGDGFITLARSQRNYGEIDLALKSFEKGLSFIENKDEYIEELQEIKDLIRVLKYYLYR